MFLTFILKIKKEDSDGYNTPVDVIGSDAAIHHAKEMINNLILQAESGKEKSLKNLFHQLFSVIKGGYGGRRKIPLTKTCLIDYIIVC